ncbi:hypothetical protein HPB52_017689 [Rhipicephalus sanguineus]|uniref:Uncharacterized protein n=1 Tax=Rhipicephalus sanguineus TaxID=34632 RepID=A0A9D4TB13_RHISA|nr:hypothetical protein HPB52_017689 [Rhipicephalus sanguineus]
MDTRSTRRAASRTDEDGPGVEDEAEAGGAAETGGQQPSLGETASSSQDSSVAVLETFAARLEGIVAPMRSALARTQPTALPKLDVPTFTGQTAGKSVIDFLDDLFLYRTVRCLLELEVLERVLPAALTDASYPATFTDVLPPVPLPISPLGPISRRSWPSSPATERPCPHGPHMDCA